METLRRVKPDQTADQEIPTLTATPIATGSGAPAAKISSGSGQQMEKGGEKERKVVTYTDTGFAPSPFTVSKDTTVTFVNESSRGMWVASDVYPTNQLLPGFDALSAVPKNGTYEYMFVKVGTWRYHNQVNPADSGTVVVK